MRGTGRDERFRQIDIHATAIAGLAVISAILIALLVEVARGHSGSPYTWLGAVAGIAYLAAACHAAAAASARGAPRERDARAGRD